MKNRRVFLAAAAPVLLLVGCMLGMRVFQTVSEASETDTENRFAPSPQPALSVERVGDKLQKQLIVLVRGQLSAIRDKNYAKALEFATPSFRKQVSPDDFGRMIEKNFASMGASNKQDYRRGQTTGKSATMLVVVRGEKGLQEGFVYTFVQHEGNWSIASCSPALSPEMMVAEMPSMLRAEINSARNRVIQQEMELRRLSMPRPMPPSIPLSNTNPKTETKDTP